VIEEKRNIFETMRKKVDHLKSLINRNASKRVKKCLGFPFIVVEPANADGTKLDLQMQKDSLKLSLVSNHDMTMHGDLEVLSLIEDAKVAGRL